MTLLFYWGDGPEGFIKGALFLVIGFWIVYKIAAAEAGKEDRR